MGENADDLPVIRENLRKGFLETQTKVNSWVANLKKKLDGEEEEEQPTHDNGHRPVYGRPRRSGDIGRRSGDRERYDADPQVLSDDFSALELRDSEGEMISWSRSTGSVAKPVSSSTSPASAPGKPRFQDIIPIASQAEGVFPRRSTD